MWRGASPPPPPCINTKPLPPPPLAAPLTARAVLSSPERRTESLQLTLAPFSISLSASLVWPFVAAVSSLSSCCFLPIVPARAPRLYDMRPDDFALHASARAQRMQWTQRGERLGFAAVVLCGRAALIHT